MTKSITIQFNAINRKEEFIKIYDKVSDCIKEIGIGYNTLCKSEHGKLTKYAANGDYESFNTIYNGILYKCKVLYSTLPKIAKYKYNRDRKNQKQYLVKLRDLETDEISSNKGRGISNKICSIFDKKTGLFMYKGALVDACSVMFRNLYPTEVLNRNNEAFHDFYMSTVNSAKYHLSKYNTNIITINNRFELERLDY